MRAKNADLKRLARERAARKAACWAPGVRSAAGPGARFPMAINAALSLTRCADRPDSSSVLRSHHDAEPLGCIDRLRPTWFALFKPSNLDAHHGRARRCFAQPDIDRQPAFGPYKGEVAGRFERNDRHALGGAGHHELPLPLHLCVEVQRARDAFEPELREDVRAHERIEDLLCRSFDEHLRLG